MSKLLYQCLFRVEFGSIAPIIRHIHDQLLSLSNSSSMSITLYAAGFKFSDPVFKTLFKHFPKSMQIATHSSHAIQSDCLAFCYSMRQVDPDCFSASKYLEYLVARQKCERLIIQLELINIKNQNYKLRPTVLNESISRSCTR